MLNVIFYLKVDLCKFVRSKMMWESAKVEKKICLVKTDYRWCAALSWKWGSNVAFMAIVRFPKIQLKNWCPCVTLTTCKISRDLSVTDKQRFRRFHFGINENFPEKFGSITVFHQQLANTIYSLKNLFSWSWGIFIDIHSYA